MNLLVHHIDRFMLLTQFHLMCIGALPTKLRMKRAIFFEKERKLILGKLIGKDKRKIEV